MEQIQKEKNKAYLPKYIPSFSDSDKERFWTKVALAATPLVCWNWTGRATIKEYGGFSLRGQEYRSPRLAYFLYYKKDPFDLLVLHTCDNPRCCNPNHLFLGTHN